MSLKWYSYGRLINLLIRSFSGGQNWRLIQRDPLYRFDHGSDPSGMWLCHQKLRWWMSYVTWHWMHRRQKHNFGRKPSIKWTPPAFDTCKMRVPPARIIISYSIHILGLCWGRTRSNASRFFSSFLHKCRLTVTSATSVRVRQLRSN